MQKNLRTIREYVEDCGETVVNVAPLTRPTMVKIHQNILFIGIIDARTADPALVTAIADHLNSLP